MTDIFDMIVKRKKRIALHTTELTLENAKVANGAQPGQFLHISIPYQTLRRPISIANVEKKKGLVTIILKEVGVGTEWLASVQTGTLLNVIGPCGTGFSIPMIANKLY
ncbi:FAD-binding oxidoreductase [Paracerasibacillus soli]|uniref:FAD-binding oxidoreductase n=1 Tax=Paracerasibacillus soli TaxID=480284 RepID=A0ABU5CQN1_9BACI|nr:FAD-binding oxidoreductase [Virgibacillus soli]MDY0408117.1 FAD-binding oxidoreductase [Virgibacillus soli]